MKAVGRFLRTFFVSLEFLILLTGFVASVLWQKPIDLLLQHFQVNAKLVEWAVLAPVGIFALVLKVCRDLRLPKDCDLAEYHSWPEYGAMRTVVHVALAHGLVFCGIALLAWMIRGPESVRFILMVTAICGAGVDYLSVYLAEITLGEVLATRTKPKVTSPKSA